MNCEHCQELLPVRERGELPSELQDEVAAHLLACADCARVSTELRALNALLDVEMTPAPDLRRRTLARLAQAGTRQAVPPVAALFAKVWPSRPLGAFSYSLALVLFGMFSGQLLPGVGANLADIPAERLYQLCAVPEPPPRAIL
jgi:anti-sigma factor RsiW